MNGDEKEEAQRPRPLSGGIWTLFSWLRRSERSSSSDSLSSVGSARTAVSFDFLAPGNCNFTNTPIVLTAPNPPSETYKKRLQERNLRRQRDRDITLHRKYGLFREFGSGYDGFSLPPVRRALDSPVNRQNRERRATSECLQRRAAYVPGKRRAPLPPAITTSATLPRSYKRKRPAPKPPVKSTVKENIDQQIHHPIRMNSNTKSEDKNNPDIELLIGKTEKCDKKVTNSKDTKLRTDKSFLKNIFENRKRNSAIETPTLRLLPSISELDKQAAEIIEHNKIRQNRNNVVLDENSNSQSSSTSYEVNSWFCTSCLRKYNSSVNSCNYCLRDNKHTSKNGQRDGLKNYFPRSSIYTQTNSNAESSSSSQSNMDERKILKELLKEMKDSLPKKQKDSKKANLITETPTLRIGSTVPEAYKDSISQPSSSSDFRLTDAVKDVKKNPEATSSNRLSITSLLSESPGNIVHYGDNQHVASSSKSSNILNKNVIHHKVTLAFENKNSSENTSSKIPVGPQASSSRDNLKEKYKILEHSPDVVEERKSNKAIEKRQIKNSNITKNTSNSKSIISSFTTKTNESKEPINNLRISNEKTSILDRRENGLKDKVSPAATSDNQSQVLPNTTKTNLPTESQISKTTPPKMLFLNFPITNAVVVNSVTVVTSHSNNNSSETPKELLTKTTKNNSTNLSALKIANEAHISKEDLKSSPQPIISSQTPPQSKADPVKSNTSSIISVKPESNLNTPLKISTLLNPFYTPRLPVIKEDKRPGPDDEELEVRLSTDLNVVENNNINREENKLKASSQPSAPSSSEIKTTHPQNDREPIQKEVVKIEPVNKNITPKHNILNEQKVLPSTSGCSKGVTINSDNNEDKLDQYDRRRHLIHQLEQSIAKGDETAAADAAAKLAKLRLSCSVLSFSSQIIADTSKQNERVSENEALKQNKIELQSEKKSDQSALQPSKGTVLDQIDIKAIKLEINETVQKIPDSKELPKNDVVKLNVPNESNLTNLLHASEPSSSTSKPVLDDIIPIEVWVEDKQAARGPIRLRISRRATMADLRRQAEHSLGLAAQLQRWIIGRTLCTDDATTIVSVAGPDLKAPFYLCLVQTETNETAVTEVIGDEKDSKNDNKSNQNGEFYTELMKLEKQSLVPNIEPFECGVCMEECAAGAGVVLRECIHTFCRECLSDVVQHCQEPVVSCPAMGCSGNLQEREIRTIVSPEEYERWLARSLATAECGTRNAFHCRTRDCTGWAFCDPGVRRFPCPVCKHTNCVQCQAIHEGETCEQYQAKLRDAVAAAETNKDDEGTQSLINSLIARGEALECPECKAIITKKWGCDWVKCSACKTEICWVTKGRRWGPGGRGDTSGGCRCGVDGQRCHPSCGYCH